MSRFMYASGRWPIGSVPGSTDGFGGRTSTSHPGPTLDASVSHGFVGAYGAPGRGTTDLAGGAAGSVLLLPCFSVISTHTRSFSARAFAADVRTHVAMPSPKSRPEMDFDMGTLRAGCCPFPRGRGHSASVVPAAKRRVFAA